MPTIFTGTRNLPKLENQKQMQVQNPEAQTLGSAAGSPEPGAWTGSAQDRTWVLVEPVSVEKWS